jgi:hydrogenase maturation protein HypF
MILEAIAATARPVPLPLLDRPGQPLLTDWRPLLPMLADASMPVSERAGAFQASLARAIFAQACCVRERVGSIRVGLTGGVFQNRKLVEQTTTLLEDAGFEVELNHWVPANDAGLSLGQIVEGVQAHAH